MRPLPALLLTALLTPLLPAAAADRFSVSEDDLFSTPDLPVQAASAESAEPDRKTVGLSGAVTAGLTYTDINDFSAGFLATLFTGPARSEYTYAGARGLVQFTSSVSF